MTAAPVAAVEESAVEPILQTSPAELVAPSTARARPSAARGWVIRCIATDATRSQLQRSRQRTEPPPQATPPSPAWAAAFVLLTAGVLAYRGLYRPQICPSLLDNVRSIVGAAALAAMVVLTARARRRRRVDGGRVDPAVRLRGVLPQCRTDRPPLVDGEGTAPAT